MMGARKRFVAERGGFSLLELIIVIGVVGILAGASIPLIGHIRYANTEKAMKEITSTLSKQQVNSMSKADRQMLYIYRLSGNYYVRSLTAEQISNAGGTASDLLTSDGIKIGNSGIDIYGKKGDVVRQVTGNDDDEYIKVVYKRSGVYDYGANGTNAEQIIIKGGTDYVITLVKNTGKYTVD